MFKLVKSLILLVICAISVKCQKIDELSQSEYFPFYVIIKHGNVFWCPGSLIRPNFVITSWHCAETLEIDDTTIVESNEQVVKVLLKRQIVDEGMIWNQETPFLLQLLEPFTINFTTNVIEIATQKVEDLRVVKVVGYDQKNELKFDYFINLKSTWDRKLKQRPLITGSDCHVSNKLRSSSEAFKVFFHSPPLGLR